MNEIYTTKTGKVLTDEDIEQLAAEAEVGYERLPTMNTTVDLLPLLLAALPDLVKNVNRLVEEELN